MTDIATANQIAPSRQVQPLQAGASVAGIIPTTFEEVFRIAQAAYKSGLAPAAFKTPEAVMIAIMTGAEVGLAPMQALNSIAVINNRPTIWGDGLLAVVRQSPACNYIKEWIEGDGDTLIAFCQTQRKGEPEPVVRSFSTSQAKRAGLWGKQGPWQQYPERMLQMRARALCLRDTYADILRGIQVREEVEDYHMRDVTPPREPGASGIAARLAQAPSPQPQISEFVASELQALLNTESGDIAATVEDAVADEYLPPELPQPIYDKDQLRAYGKALLRCTSEQALSAGHLSFFGPDVDTIPDKDDAETPWGKIYKLHRWRIAKDGNPDDVTASIERIVEGLA